MYLKCHIFSHFLLHINSSPVNKCKVHFPEVKIFTEFLNKMVIIFCQDNLKKS